MAATSQVEGLEKRIKKIATNEDIQDILDKRGITPERLIAELEAIALNNIGDYFTQDKYGRFALTLAELSKEQMAGISEVMVDVSSTVPNPKDPHLQALKAERIRVKIAPKTEALMALIRLRTGEGSAVAKPAAAGRSESGKPVSQVGTRLGKALARAQEMGDKPAGS